MEYKRVQALAKETMNTLSREMRPGMTLRDVRKFCEETMLRLGADSFWYWDIGAFVFAGEETAISVSGREYETSDRVIRADDIVTVDLSPQIGDTWGDYARTLILQDGVCVSTEAVRNPEWKRGLQMEETLHEELCRFVTPETTFEALYAHMNRVIEDAGFVNLDFAGNLGHSIVRRKEDRVYTEKGNALSLGAVEYFTFEPHIALPGSVYGYKREDICYFEDGVLRRL